MTAQMTQDRRAGQPNIAGLLNRDRMEHEKHRTCSKCGGPLPEKGYVDEWDCPVCSATFLGPYRTRLLKAVIWGGVTALACFLFLSFVAPGELHENFPPLRTSAFVWVIITVVILLPGGGWYGGDWGNGGGGNGGG
jgi:predicted RNA-binding Zn-ribbon protein involved in translation (DUF1610 family)